MQAFWLFASLAAAMASSSGTPPPAASQGVGPPRAASQGEHEDAHIFNHIKVATYNVGASQEDSFSKHGKQKDFFKLKLQVSSKGETGRACIHHPKGLPRGRAHPSGGARPLPAWPFGRWVLMSDPASPVQVECQAFMRSVDVVCFQELSEVWRQYVSTMCFNAGWTTHGDEMMNVLTAIRTSAVANVTAKSIYCFPSASDTNSKHRWWRTALETMFLCSRSGRRMSVVNLHIVSGSHESATWSSAVPGKNPESREKFKAEALKNTLRQAKEHLDEHAASGPGVLIVAGDMNLKRAEVLVCLSEFESNTNQTLVGMCQGENGRDWIVSSVAAMEVIRTDVTPVDPMHAVVAAKFTNALGRIDPIPRCIAGSAECMTSILNSLKDHKRTQAKLAEDQQCFEEQNDPTTRVQNEVLPQLAIVTGQCTAPPSTAAAAPAATSQRSSGDVEVNLSDEDEVDGGGGSDAERGNNKFLPDGPPVVRQVTRKENGYIMVEASPVVEMDALGIVFRSDRPLLRIAGLATFGRGEVRAGLVR